MTTVLLLDDELVFRAVEGTCLRREPFRLMKAGWNDACATARAARPDLIVAAGGGERGPDLAALLGDSRIGAVPVIVLVGHPGGEPAPAPPRPGPVELVRFHADRAGRPDYGDLDPRLDAAIRRRLAMAGRRTDRVAVSLPVRCEGGGVNLTLRTKNISPSGLFLKTNVPIPAGQRLDVAFSLKEPGAEPVSVSGIAEVVRQVGTGGSGAAGHTDLIPGVGVRFLDLGEESSRALRRFIRVASEGKSRRAPRSRSHTTH